MMVAPVAFGIPLMSKRVARDWGSTSELLAATLRSVFNQDGEVRVILACHERPTIPECDDSRVTTVPVSFDIPRFRWEMEVDRMRKLEAIGAALRVQGGGMLFTLDADDLVARGLTKALCETTTKTVVIKRGYRLDARRGQYQDLAKFYGKCGSCVGVRWDPDELPAAPLADNPPIYHEFCEHRHYTLPKFFERMGWSMTFLQPPFVTYLINHGSNQSEVITRDSLKWRLYFRMMQWKSWTPALDADFGSDSRSREAGIYTGDARFSTEARY